MEDAESCIQQAADVARQATHFDTTSSFQAAIYFYRQAATLLERAASLGVSSPAITDRIQQYIGRADTLEKQGTSPEATPMESGQSDLSRANFLMLEGLEEDEAGNSTEAIELYSEAVKVCLQAVRG